MDAAHLAILVGGGLGVLAILAGLAGARIGTPLLLVFLVIGMLAGEDGPGGIPFDDFQLTYLLGSIALVIILFDGGQKTTLAMVRDGMWPALLLATLGVVVTAALVGAFLVAVTGIPWLLALLLGSLVAPTDAAAVAGVLHQGSMRVPHRVLAILELESGLNDPISVFLTVLLTQAGLVGIPHHASAPALDLLRDMGGGVVFGALGGGVMIAFLRVIRLDAGLRSAMLVALALVLFGAAQMLGTSGFLAVYLAAVLVGNRGRGMKAVEPIFAGFAWIAQIVLFLMLGLLVTPHETWPWMTTALLASVMLIFIGRPFATFACLIWFGLPVQEIAFIAWVGLRGAVPIYLAVIPVLAGMPMSGSAFDIAFAIVLVSLIVQGWTVSVAARLLGFSTSAANPPVVPAP